MIPIGLVLWLCTFSAIAGAYVIDWHHRRTNLATIRRLGQAHAQGLLEAQARHAGELEALRLKLATEWHGSLYQMAMSCREAGTPVMIIYENHRINLWPLTDQEEQNEELQKRARPVVIQ